MILTVCLDMGEGLLLATGFAVLTTIIRMQRLVVQIYCIFGILNGLNVEYYVIRLSDKDLPFS